MLESYVREHKHYEVCFKCVQLIFIVSVQSSSHKVTYIACMNCNINNNVYCITNIISFCALQLYNTDHVRAHFLLPPETKHCEPQ